MNKKSVIYSGILLFSLLVTSVLLNRDVVSGLQDDAEVTLATTASTHLLGETIVFSGSLVFGSDESAVVSGVTLSNTTGPQTLSIALPVYDTSDEFIDLSDSVAGTLTVKVTHSGVTSGGTLPGTLPGGTLPSEWKSGTFTGGNAGGTITYEVHWTPPVALYPIPNLTLIPETESYFTIPTLSPPGEAAGTKLPSTELAFEVPTAGETSGTALPETSLAEVITVPTITLTTNAPSAITDLPNSMAGLSYTAAGGSTAYMGSGATTTYGFAIPTPSYATSSAADFPLATDEFAIPSPSVTTSSATSFEDGMSLGNGDRVFKVPDIEGSTTSDTTVKGMTVDSDGDFWMVIQTSGNDSLIEVNGTSYAVTATTTMPSASFDGVLSIGSKIFLLENKHRCWDDIEDDNCDYNHRVFKIDSSSSLPTGKSDSDWAAATGSPVTAIYHFDDQWANFAGLTAGASGDIWGVDENGCVFYNMYATGSDKDSFWGPCTQSRSIAFANDLLYTAKSGTITQYTNEGNSIQSVDVGVGSINSLSFSGSTMYFTSNEDTYVYATFVGDTVEGAAGSRSSKGIAYHYTTASSEAALYVLVDGSPKDYILKVDASDGSLITNFSSDGWAPAPSANTEGIEFFSDALWVIANESSGCCDNQRKLYKINKTSGKVTKTYDISNQVNNDIGDITNDGTNLIVYAKSMNDVFTVSTTGGDEGKTWPGGNLNGAKAIAYHPVQQAFYGISGTSMNKFDSSWNDTGASYTLELDPNATSTTAVASVQGATFVDKAPYNDFWFVANGRVFHSYVSQSVTTEPIGLAWSSADAPGLGSAESLWVLVDAEPFDKILRVDTSDGELNTNFDDDGVADAPSGNTEGITFVTEGTDNYLYVVANEGSDQWNRTKYLYKLSAVDASVQAGYPKDLNNVVWDDLGGITYDGEDLVISAKSNSNLWKISTSGDKRVEGWPCCTSGFTQGVKALAYHTGRGVLYGANGTSLLGISSDIQSYESEASLKLDGVNMSGNVHGMTFAGDVLYIARTQSVSSVDTGYITATAFAESMTTKPQGLALSPSTASYQGTSVGSALWVVVDGTPKDRLIKLTLSNSAWSADTDFGSDTTKNGSAELPDSNVTGVTYLGDDGLYVIGGSDTQNPKMYQLSPVNGSVLNTYSLCSPNMMGGPAMGGGGGMDMCNRPAGGLANNGDDRLIVFGSTENTYFFYDTSGQLQDNNPMGHGGADAVDFIQSDSTYWTADDDSIQMWLNPGGDVYNIWQAETYDMGNPNGALENIQGFVVCPKAATGASYPCTTKDMFIGWNDGTDGYISQAVPPSPITNTPRDVAYNADDDVLYILVDGKGADVVVAVDPTTGLVKENSDGEEIFFTLANEQANGVAYLNSKVYVSEEEDCGGPGAGCFGPPGTLITVLESDTLAKDTTFNLNTSNGSPGGMDSDGTNLVATAQYGGSRVDYFSPSSGFPTKEVYLWHPTNQGWHEENFSDVAYSTSTPTYFLSKSGMIYRATEDGDIMEEWSITAPDSSVLNTITGLDFVGSSLYIADATTAKIYKALIPLPTITITNTPRAMASASSTLWVAVDAEPVDKILKLAVSTSSATTIASFDSPGTETDGLAIHDGTLWVITNDKISIETPGGGLMQATLPMMYQVDPDTGLEKTHGPLMFQNSQMGMGPGQPDVFKDTVGGLASDGQYLYSGTHAQTGKGTPGTLYRIDPSNQMCMNMFGEQVCGPEIRTITQFEGQHTYLDSIQSVEVAPSASYADDRRLIISGSPDTGMEADRISRLDITAAALAQDSVVHSQYSLLDDEGQAGTLDIRGMAVVGTILFMADATNGEIIGTALPENTGVEMTIVGSYTSSLSAVTGSGTHSDTASYSVGRNTNVAVQLTSPSNDFVATTTSATIAGRVSDPAITTVSVGIQLPFTEFLNDEVLLDGTSAALWSVSNQHGSGASQWYLAPGGSGSGCPECGAAGWRFGKQAGYSATGEKTFADGNSRVAGTLTSAEVYPISQGSTLEFTTAWNTEFFPETDIKLVQIAEITQDLAGNDQVGSWQTIGQIVNFVDPFWMPEPEARHDDFQWLIVDPLPFKPNVQTFVEIPLDGLAGKRIKVRFKFDTMDEWANEGNGWFVDNIKLSGSGTKTISIPTTALDTYVVATVNGTSTKLYREFSTTFPLAEGENTVVATAIQPYAPSLSGIATISGFVDQTAPVITLYNVPANTSDVTQQLKGTLKEPTIDQPGAIMQITQNVTSVAGATSSVVIGKVTTEGEFSFGVSLQEGTNTFVATATDGGGLTTTKTVISVADLTAPEAVVTIVTVTSEGEAVVGDQYFVLVAAEDSLSGVGTSTLVSTGQRILPASQTPAILREMHSLGIVGTATTTHITLAEISQGTPVGLNTIAVRVQDQAGNEKVVSGNLNVVSARTNRNYFMFPGFNYMGLALIPDDGDGDTTDDASLDRLMDQDVTSRVSQAFIDLLSTSTVTLGDVVESTFAFNQAGDFILHTPGDGALDTLTELNPFQGMIVKTKETVTEVEVFKKVGVAGFSATQAVPIRVNIEGVFFREGQLPPSKELRVGYNLIAPHTLSDTLFDTVYRGALIPKQLAVSALSFERRVGAVMTGTTISAEVFEGFSANSIGNELKPVLSYWTFIADDPDDDRRNALNQQLGPTITP